MMDLNQNENLINILSELDETKEEDLLKFDYSIYMLKKQKNADFDYQARKISLAPDVLIWSKKQLINQLRVLKEQGGEENNQFNIGNYNDEIAKKEQIAKLDLTTISGLLDKKNKLISAIRNEGESDVYEDKKTNFLIARVMMEGKEVLFSYYRSDKGAKKNAGRKKNKLLVFKNTNQFEFVNHTVIELGGNFDFILIDDWIFINNVTNFEHAFDYRDVINQKRDANLEAITSMPFFQSSDVNVEVFEKICKKFVYSRSLAQIQPETLEIFQEKIRRKV